METDITKETKKFPELVVGILIKNKDDKFLLIKSPKWAKLTTVGGHIEFGEVAEETIVREVKEEVGLDVYGPEFVRVVEVIRPEDFGTDRHLVGLQYVVNTDAAEDQVVIDNDEAVDYKWLTAEEILASDEVKETIQKTMEIYLNQTKKAKKHGLFSHGDKKLEELERERNEFKAGWQRAVADYQNLQKEHCKDKTEFIKYANGNLILDLLPIMDNFKIAFSQIPEAEKNSAWVTGFSYIKKQLEDFLKSNGVEEIKTVGEKFDHAIHEAIESRHEEDQADDIILEERKAGYKLNGKVIQVAKVVVNNKQDKRDQQDKQD